MKISSPIVSGSGVFIVHNILAENIKNYQVYPYHPLWSLLPPSLCRAIKFPKSDIIHATPDHPLWKKQPDTPLVLTFHNYVLDQYMKKKAGFSQNIYYSTILKKYTIQSVNQAQVITAVSSFTANLVKNELNLNQDIKVIYNGVDTNKFIPKQKTINKKNVNVLFVGNMTNRKGMHLLKEISNKLEKNIYLYTTKGLRKNTFNTKHDNLIDVGNIPYSSMPDLYNKADILLFPTLREGFGLAVAEAMSCGLPVVASDCSSIPELLDDRKGGFLCPVGDVDSFVEKIILLANDKKLRLEMGEYNRNKVEVKFTIERMINEYKLLFEQVLAS